MIEFIKGWLACKLGVYYWKEYMDLLDTANTKHEILTTTANLYKLELEATRKELEKVKKDLSDYMEIENDYQ